MKKVFFALITIACSASYCGHIQEGHAKINIVNCSKKNIRYILEQGIYLNDRPILECDPNNKILLPGGTTRISSNETGYLEALVDRVWEQQLRPNEKMKIAFIDDDLYMSITSKYQYNCDSIQKYVPVLHCYLLTLEDLQRMNWTVVYPPEE